MLRQALAKDQKKKKQKKAKGKKEKKKKKVKNLLDDHSVEELYEELVERDIIVKYERCSIDNFIGDLNYKAYEARREIL